MHSCPVNVKDRVRGNKVVGKEYPIRVAAITQQIAALCERYEVKRAILFGSWAKGTALEQSDIDIAVSGASDFYGLKEEIEGLETLYTIDLVDLEHCENELLKEDISRYGCEIYKKI